MTATFINSFILFFVTIDTIGNLPFFLSLTEGAKIKKRNQIALKSVIIAFFIMITFAYLGRYLLEAIHVSLNAIGIGALLSGRSTPTVQSSPLLFPEATTSPPISTRKFLIPDILIRRAISSTA